MSGLTGQDAGGPGGLSPTPDSTSTGPHDLPSEDHQKILDLAKKRWERGNTWESDFRTHFIDDIKFAEADAYNQFQWPNAIRQNRDQDQRPCLTINKTRQHNLQIINDAKQNKPGIAVRPVGNEATYESSQAIAGLVRHIEYISNASAAYDQATSFQVRGGYGVLRVATDYADAESFDQDIFIRGIQDPLTVVFDPDAKQPDKSDSRWAMIFDNIDRKEFGEIYPKYADWAPTGGIGSGDGWITDSKIRICEYFYCTAKADKTIQYYDPEDHKLKEGRVSKLTADLAKRVIDDPRTRQRQIVWNEVHWCLIVGDRIVEEKVWPGKYIPLVPVIGEETIIDGRMDRKGHTRAMLDPQRMYNYWASAAVEFGALQTKTPWVAPAAAIEGLEEYWNNANRINTSVLPWNHLDDDGNPVPAPVRPQAPEQAPLYIAGMQQTQQEMMMASGQYQAQMGQPSNERSGKAIQERQRQGDNATYHFIDQLGIAIRHIGKIIIDLLPHIYTAKRVVQILGEDGMSTQVQIDPDAQQAYKQELDANNEIAQRILNPNVGRYEVMADLGPGYATRRQEAWNAIQQILTNAPQLTALIGDILLINGDFPGAEEAAIRMKRMVPPQALGKGPSQTEQALQQQLTQTQDTLAKTFNELVTAKQKLHGKDMQKEIDTYEAQTGRAKVIMDHMPVPAPMADELMTQTIRDMMMNELGPIVQSALAGIMGQSGKPGQTQDFIGAGPSPTGGMGSQPNPAPTGPDGSATQPSGGPQQ